MSPNTINAIFRRLQQANPHPTTELNYKTNFELLVAVILSAQATDKSVNLATDTLFKIAHTPANILALGETGLKKYIRTIGLYSTKAKNIIATCKLLIEKFNSEVPQERTQLESLPGVGRKTANVILNTCFRQPVIAVDTHIFRVANRIGLAHGKTPLAVEEQLEKNIPDKYKLDAHHWLILHGRYVCTARKPHCYDCQIADLCTYKEKNNHVHG